VNVDLLVLLAPMFSLFLVVGMLATAAAVLGQAIATLGEH
jgi:hypothetical protein